MEQSDDSDDSDSEDDSEEDANGKKPEAQAERKPEGENKRGRPEDMQGPFVAVKRANVSLLASAAEKVASQPATSAAAAKAPGTSPYAASAAVTGFVMCAPM